MGYFIDKLSGVARQAFRTIRTRRIKAPTELAMQDRTVEWVKQRNLRNIAASTRDNNFESDSRGRNIDASSE